MTEAMTQAQRELIEEFGLLYEQMGSTRMCGRVGAWLLLCDPPVQSLTEIAEGLGVSKAAVSGAARLLLLNHVVERVGEPGQRGDFYRALPVDAEGLVPTDHVRTLSGLLRRAIASVAERDQTQSNYALMHELLELAVFIEAELPELLARWRERRSGAAPATPDDTHAHTYPGGTP
jgi:hypothetical protein